MKPIKIQFENFFWPSGRGSCIGHIDSPISKVSELLSAPVFEESGQRFVVLLVKELGYVTIEELFEDQPLEIYVDESVDPFYAAPRLDEFFGQHVKIEWPVGYSS